MSNKSNLSRTMVAIAAALAMSSVTVGAAVGPAQANAATGTVHSAHEGSRSMPELEVLEAKVPARTPRLEPEPPRSTARGTDAPAGSTARSSAAPATSSRRT